MSDQTKNPLQLLGAITSTALERLDTPEEISALVDDIAEALCLTFDPGADVPLSKQFRFKRGFPKGDSWSIIRDCHPYVQFYNGQEKQYEDLMTFAAFVRDGLILLINAIVHSHLRMKKQAG